MKVYNTEKRQHFYSKRRVLEGSTDKHMVQTIENKETVVGDVKLSSPIAQSSYLVKPRDEITLTRNDLTVKHDIKLNVS